MLAVGTKIGHWSHTLAVHEPYRVRILCGSWAVQGQGRRGTMRKSVGVLEPPNEMGVRVKKNYSGRAATQMKSPLERFAVSDWGRRG